MSSLGDRSSRVLSPCSAEASGSRIAGAGAGQDRAGDVTAFWAFLSH